jgi:hypothetical protein
MSRTNRDHAKKKQRSMMEDAVIAEQLKTLLMPVMTGQKGFYRELQQITIKRVCVQNAKTLPELDLVTHSCGGLALKLL